MLLNEIWSISIKMSEYLIEIVSLTTWLPYEWTSERNGWMKRLDTDDGVVQLQHISISTNLFYIS